MEICHKRKGLYDPLHHKTMLEQFENMYTKPYPEGFQNHFG